MLVILKHPIFYIALLGSFLMGTLVHKMRQAPPPPPPPTPPSENPYKDTGVAASGLIESSEENTSIGVTLPGLVTQVLVKVGDRVTKGQPLLQLDDRDIRAQLPAQQAAIAVQQAQLARTRDQLDRLRKISASAVSADDLQNRTNDLAIAQAQLDLATATLHQTESLLERLTILAPRDGTALRVNIRAGEYAPASPKDPLIILGDTKQFQIRADVDENNAWRILPGSHATAYIKGGRIKDGLRIPVPLRFLRIEPYVLPKTSLTGASNERVDTRVLQVIFAIEGHPDESIYVGQQVDIFIESLPAEQPKK